MEKEIALVYMVGGLSSRFGGKIKAFSKIGPKGESLIEYSLHQALPAGFTKIVLIVSQKTEKVFRDFFGDSYKNIPVTYALQKFDESTRDKPWGTVDALCSAQHLLDCPFVVCNGDDLYGNDAFEKLVYHLKNNTSDATIGYHLGNVLPKKGTANRGIFEIEAGQVLSITETFDISLANFEEMGLQKSSPCSMNLFGLIPSTLHSLQNILLEFKKQHKKDRRIECLLPQELSKLLLQNSISMTMYETSNPWRGVTHPEDEAIVRAQLLDEISQ